tara:strand:+ start:231 stop:422 length:192 start_codon:yes stop_codon:yes gene_type:complete
MLLLGKIALFIAVSTAIIAILVPLLCMAHFIIRNNVYLLEAVIDEIADLGSRLSQKFKRKHKK